ncbi:Maf family protein [Ferrimonas lipolytica]|uniref:dTTP/UTP pyrophosphatase n=1 Tax=Ferrimonas lipolytica TaxID=2724191 RepID=A0A6H1UGF8_9GAMM|nr:Maf family protein [Ferrimonas lipolytica]QIZ77908.1 septum formation inhibitor Maf [Ferrimonas lipolytica]
MNTLYLASTSPRRQQLLAQLGYEFSLIKPELDETPLPDELAPELVIRLARGKAQAGLSLLTDGAADAYVLGSDTIVVVDGHILGKPKDSGDAKRMLQTLSNRGHQVMTAIAVASAAGTEHTLVVTDVQFCELSDSDIEQYWHTGEPADKAGSYGIQGIGGNFVSSISGSYSAVVGLPLVETKQLLEATFAQQ